MGAGLPGDGDRIIALRERLRYHVRLRTRLRKGYKRLRAAYGRVRKRLRAAARVELPFAPRLRSHRARIRSRRRRRQIGDLEGLASASAGRKLTPPADVRRTLASEPARGPGSVDVIVCVRDALDDVHRCLASVLECSDRPLRLIVVDDGSDAPTADYLARLRATNPAVDLRRNDGPAHGYTVAANIGLRASTAEYAILLNSDTIVTRGWLDRLLSAFADGDRIGIVGPLSNAASHQSVPKVREDGQWAVNELPDWLTADGMSALVAHLPGANAIRVPFVNGFCYCIHRRVIDAIGGFDEDRFADGYSEENDYSRRAADAGFALAVATRAYVAHAKSRSYGRGGRAELAKRNYRRFLDKHGEQRIKALVAEVEASEPLAALRDRVGEAIHSPQSVAAALPRLAVTFVLPSIAQGGSGGSHSIYQEAAAMRSLGLHARIAIRDQARERAEATYPDSGALFVTYRNDAELAALLDGDDVVVATHFKSAGPVARAVEGGRVGLGAYYVQDYEPLFVPDGSPDAAEASASYRLIPGAVLFAKTDWIRETLSELEGIPVAKVEPSLDQAVFHPGGRTGGDGRPHIIAMVRPRTPRRAARETLDVLARVAADYGSRVRITTFGCRPDELDTLGAVRAPIDHRGLLGREQVAELMRSADIFLDCSWYQAFGRTSLEAMACGATSVLPEVGGVTEFAEHEGNCLLADTSSRDRTYAAVARLLDDPELLNRLKERAVRTASRYSAVRAALSEYVLFCYELERRSEARAADAPERSQPVLTAAQIDWRGVEFVDLGCSSGGSVRYCARRFAASRGIGIDRDERKVARARREGIEAVLGDATRLDLPQPVRFISAMDFFEHLPDLATVRAVLESAARNATDFIYIRHPSFEGEEYLQSLGLRQYWWNWHGRTAHVRVADYREMLDELGLDRHVVRYLDPVEHSSHPSIIPADAPVDQHDYDPDRHGSKPDIPLDGGLWRAQEIFVALRPIDAETWNRLTSPWGRDRTVDSAVA